MSEVSSQNPDPKDFVINEKTIEALIVRLIPTSQYFEARFDGLEEKFDYKFEVLTDKFDALSKSQEELKADMDKRFDTMQSNMEKRFEQTDKRINAMQTEMDKRFEQVDKRFDQLTRRMDRFMIWSFGTSLTMAALIIGILKYT